MSHKIDKEMDKMAEKLEKAGEGSRGGKVIGHTLSGKAIYHTHAEAPVGHHSNFTHQDHAEAANLHSKLAHEAIERFKQPRSASYSRAAKDKDFEAGLHHHGQSTTHTLATAFKKSEENEQELEKGAGTRGAIIAGYTPSGKPKYQSNLQAQESWRERNRPGKDNPLAKKAPKEGDKDCPSEPSDILEKPPVSEAQRRLMGAAAHGDVSGVPASVGKEFIEADRGGKLPARKKKKIKKSEEELAMKDTFKSIMNKVKDLGPEGLKKASANLSEDQRVLLAKILTKAATKPQKIEDAASLKPKEHRDLEAHDMKPADSGFDQKDEDIMDPKKDEVNHQGQAVEGKPGQKIEDPKREAAGQPSDEKPLNPQGTPDESSKMDAAERKRFKESSSMKKSDEEMLKSMMKKVMKKAMKKMMKKMKDQKPEVEGAQKEFDPKAKDPRELFAKPAEKKAAKEEKKDAKKESSEPMEKKYEGFDKLKNEISREGSASNPGAVAAAIGREKYGKQKFQHAAAEGKKMKKSEKFEQVLKAEQVLEAMCKRMIEKGFKQDEFIEKAKKMGLDAKKCGDMWMRSEKCMKNMKKSCEWNDLQSDLFSTSYKRGRNFSFAKNDEQIEADDKKQADTLKKGEYINEIVKEDLKKSEGAKKVSVQDLIEQGLDRTEGTIMQAQQKLEFGKTYKPVFTKSFDEADLVKSLGIDSAKVEEIIKK